MENKINVAELLKCCPEGTELNCTMYDNLYFESCQSDCYDTTIRCYTLIGGIKTIIIFTKYGTFNKHSGAKCVIFPKGQTSWDGFLPPDYEFKDGDVVVNYNWIGITKGGKRHRFIPTYCVIRGDNGRFEAYNEIKETWYFDRLATEDEKERLFKAIKDSGYKWNTERKCLEKLIKPKFKAGDRVRHKELHKDYIYEISEVYDTSYALVNSSWIIQMASQDCYELVPNKFDISTLKPFDQVLVRNNIISEDKWKIQFFEKFNKVCEYPFICMGSMYKYKQCIPYKGNEHLLDSKDNCDDFYKTWE